MIFQVHMLSDLSLCNLLFLIFDILVVLMFYSTYNRVFLLLITLSYDLSSQLKTNEYECVPAVCFTPLLYMIDNHITLSLTLVISLSVVSRIDFSLCVFLQAFCRHLTITSSYQFALCSTISLTYQNIYLLFLSDFFAVCP